jgi:hypothetical protein
LNLPDFSFKLFSLNKKKFLYGYRFYQRSFKDQKSSHISSNTLERTTIDDLEEMIDSELENLDIEDFESSFDEESRSVPILVYLFIQLYHDDRRYFPVKYNEQRKNIVVASQNGVSYNFKFICV